MKTVRLKTTYTWRKEWISAYESPWSIFEKFKLANQVRSKDIIKTLAVDRVQGLCVIGPSHYNLKTLDSLDPDRLEHALGVDLVRSYLNDYERLIGILPMDHMNGIKGRNWTVYFREHLTFCMDCMKTGFHSLFNQFKLVHKCPYHQTPLMSACPQCNIRFSYSLSDEFMETPFQCNCGYKFFQPSSSLRYYEDWISQPLTKLQCPKIKAWLNLTEKDKQKLKNMYFLPNLDLDQYPNTMEYFLSVMNASVLGRSRRSTVTSSRNIKKIKGDKEKQDNIPRRSLGGNYFIGEYELNIRRFHKMQQDLYDSLHSTLAGVAHHIRYRILHQHKQCINRLKQLQVDEPICPYAYAYIAWRRAMQNYNGYYDVDARGRPDRINPYGIEVPRFDPFIRDFYHLWEGELNNITTTSRSATKWLLNRMIVHIGMNHFRNWLRIAGNLTLKKKFPSYQPFEYEHLPFFILVFDINPEEPFEFHWWSSDSSYELPELECPNRFLENTKN